MEGVPLVTTGSTTTSSGDLSATAPCVSEAGLATETIGTSPTSTTATSTTCASASGGTSNDPRNEKSVYDGRQICGESLCPLLPLVAEKKEKKKKKKKTLRSHDRHKEKKKKKHASKPKKEKQTKKKKHSEKEFSEDEASTRKKRKRHSKSKIDNESDEAVPPSSKKSRKDKKSPKKSKGEDEESELRKVKPPIALTQSHYETRQSCALKDVVQVLTAPNKQVNYVTKEDMTAYTRQLKMVFRIFQKERRDGLMTTRDLDGCLRALGKSDPEGFCKKLVKTAGDSHGLVSLDAFMEYMVARKNLRVSKKKATKKFNEDKLEEAEASKRPRKVKTTPKKGVTNNQSPSAKQSETHLPTPTTQQGAHRPPELLRGLSLTDFFTENAGLQEEIQVESMDSFGNPLAREYDLGLESAFGIFSIIMFSFHNEHGVFWQSIQALQEKGFRTYLAGTEEEFLRELPKYDEAWFASDKSSPSTHDPKKFLEAIKTFREKSGSLYILAENRPFFVQANEVLPELLGFTLEDNTPGGNVLSVTQSKIPAPKTFCKHLITTGLVSLYEGHTICRPSSLPARESLTVIGMSSDGYPCFICCDYEGHKGRIVVDCGFTKLCDEWWNQTAGTGRFVRNVAVWLTGLDHRAKIGAPPTGPLPITQPQGTAASTEASTTTTIEQTPAVTQAIETTTSSSELPPPSSASPGLGGDTTQKVEVTPLEITPETTEPKTAHCVEVPTKSND